jgi:putative ABC transport system substrate-binding protein
MMKRRDFITLLGGAAAAWPLAARAQRAGPMRRIGVLMGRLASDPEGQNQTAALRRGLEELGWLSGHNVEIDYRWQTDDDSQRQAFAQELVGLKPDILVANTTPALAAAHQATATIPIVFVAIADPVAQGFVQSLASPGGNTTGFGAEEPSRGGEMGRAAQGDCAPCRNDHGHLQPKFGAVCPNVSAVGASGPPLALIGRYHFACSQRNRA